MTSKRIDGALKRLHSGVAHAAVWQRHDVKSPLAAREHGTCDLLTASGKLPPHKFPTSFERS